MVLDAAIKDFCVKIAAAATALLRSFWVLDFLNLNRYRDRTGYVTKL